MKRLVYAALATLLLAVPANAGDHGNGHGKHKKDHDAEPARTEVIVFTTHDTAVIREYYAPQRRSLPPGLQKKYERTGHLPPGWEKKMRPMPVVVERQLPPLPPGYHRGVFDGHAVIYRPGGTIIDATVIF
jgi:hypothetical protein